MISAKSNYHVSLAITRASVSGTQQSRDVCLAKNRKEKSTIYVAIAAVQVTNRARAVCQIPPADGAAMAPTAWRQMTDWTTEAAQRSISTT